MRVAIVGSREYRDLDAVTRFVAKLCKKYPGAIIVSGGARGVDEAAEAAALDCGLGVISYRPTPQRQYDVDGFTIETITHGEAALAWVTERNRPNIAPWSGSFAVAAKFRNVWIVEDAEQVVAFYDGTSPGTRFPIETARAYGKEPHNFMEK